LGPGRTPRWRPRRVVAAVIAATVETETVVVAAAIEVIVAEAASVRVAGRVPLGGVGRLPPGWDDHGPALRASPRVPRARRAHRRQTRRLPAARQA
jgi:hypothetical protein